MSKRSCLSHLLWPPKRARNSRYSSVCRQLNPQRDMDKSLASVKPTVNSADLKKQEDFTADFGQEG
jgi:hypothetical protein